MTVSRENIEKIKKLRFITGCGLMMGREAMEKCDWDLPKAVVEVTKDSPFYWQEELEKTPIFNEWVVYSFYTPRDPDACFVGHDDKGEIVWGRWFEAMRFPTFKEAWEKATSLKYHMHLSCALV